MHHCESISKGYSYDRLHCSTMQYVWRNQNRTASMYNYIIPRYYISNIYCSTKLTNLWAMGLHICLEITLVHNSNIINEPFLHSKHLHLLNSIGHYSNFKKARAKSTIKKWQLLNFTVVQSEWTEGLQSKNVEKRLSTLGDKIGIRAKHSVAETSSVKKYIQPWFKHSSDRLDHGP